MPTPGKKSRSRAVTSKGNLTGTARHVRDLAAEVHNNIQRWNKLHLEGYDILKSILQQTEHESNPQSLQELCDQLTATCDALNGVLKDLEEIARKLNVVSCLQKTDEKLFTTWPASKFGEAVEAVCEGYRNEMQSKRYICENAAHGSTDWWKMMHLAGWVCQPMLPGNLKIIVESLLIETGHR